ATGHQDGTIRFWDPITGQPRQTRTEHKLPVYALAYSRDGKYLVSGGGVCKDGRNEGELFLWDAATLKFQYTFRGLLGAVNALTFSPDGRSLAAALSGDEISVWEMPSRTPRKTIPFPGMGVVSVAFRSDSMTLAASFNDGRISLCDA